MTDWTIDHAKEFYNIKHWSSGFFDINAAGHLCLQANDHHAPIDLVELSQTINQAGLRWPVLVRFADILQQRVQTLQQAFKAAIKQYDYGNGYTPVYPIKVNQQARVVDEILHCNTGLEVGSKPELMAVLGLPSTNALIICNGYKDSEYIRLALIGRKLGRNTVIIIENFAELLTVLHAAKRLNLNPVLGLRVRLASLGAGKWQNSGGQKAKFGLFSSAVLQVVNHLKRSNQLAYLQCLHFHLGSQVANIRDIQLALREAARFYVALRQLGAEIDYLDVGGGLGVDYEGTRSRSDCSMNYTLQEYANTIVSIVHEACTSENLSPPHLITEAGRAMTAHHAVLITNIIAVEKYQTCPLPKIDAAQPQVLHDLKNTYDNLAKGTIIEAYHDICYGLSKVQDLFVHNVINLEQRALAEQIYNLTCLKIRTHLNANYRSHREILDNINEKFADKYFANFSLFQSVPDVWAIDQIFPIMPLSNLHHYPKRRATLVDITCDSDGCFNHYVDGQNIEKTLALPEYDPDNPYLIGIFLVGAYQEILGDLHNLFGDTDSVLVKVNEQGGYQLIEPTQGDSVANVLQSVHFDPKQLQQSYERQLQQTNLSADEQHLLLEELTAGLAGYTYYE